MLTGKLRHALFLGLDRENVNRLLAGQPIRVPSSRTKALGFEPIMVVIHFGETQQAMLDEIAEHGESLVLGEDK